MRLVLCVDMDDDIGRKTGLETPLVGRRAVESGAVALATTDPEDSDVNVLFKGLQVVDQLGEDVAVAAVTGREGRDVTAARAVGREVDQVLEALSIDPESVRAVVVTDGAQDESVLPVIRSRLTVDGVRRVVVRQAEGLESTYYTIKQVLDDPETRGTILVPLGILLLIYPLAVVASEFNLPGAVLGTTSALLGLYLIARGFDLPARTVEALGRLRHALYAGRVTLVTYSVAVALLVVAGISGLERLDVARAGAVEELAAVVVLAALVDGALLWVAAAGIMTSLGQVTDAYLHGRFRVRYLNAPFYVVAIAAVLHGLSAYVLGQGDLSYLAGMLAAGTVLGLASTLTFAVAEARLEEPHPG
ncbi:MAG: DUF373 family protein [Halobacteriales archaeon]